MTDSKATKALLKNISLVSYERSNGGINSHSEWIFERTWNFRIGKEKHTGIARAGIDRNHDIYGANYHCFGLHKIGDKWVMINGNGEGANTKWYSNLGLAKRQIGRYLKGKIKCDQLCYVGETK